MQRDEVVTRQRACEGGRLDIGDGVKIGLCHLSDHDLPEFEDTGPEDTGPEDTGPEDTGPGNAGAT